MAKPKKRILTSIKLQIPGGNATPAPPVGPALGQHGLNIQDFCNQFNNKTKEMGDTVVPVVISVNEEHEADLSNQLHDGDEVKIFSSVSGG